ncbi:MAG: VanZ family protein [Erysipelotrichaceae bacterium]|jgi:VanZ family protein|nr:VanZ family protein [Erysipelotrichaceae bacterium]
MKFIKKNLKWILLTIFITLNLFIVFESCLPAGESSSQSNLVVDISKDIINFFRPDTITNSNIDALAMAVRKVIGHFLLFALNGLIGFFTFISLFKNKKWWLSIIINLIIGLSVAILTEIIQIFTPGRAGLISDVLLDYSGYLLPLLIGYSVILIIRLTKRKKQSIDDNQKP